MSKESLSAAEWDSVKIAIKSAEQVTSGEIKICIQRRCNEDVLDRAAYYFKELKMHETALRNGVLIFLSTEDHKFAIIGDAGINAVVEKDFWENTKEMMLNHFKQKNISAGLISGIESVGLILKNNFPYTEGDKNELSDDIAFYE